MQMIPGFVQRGYLRMAEHVVTWLVAANVSPNAITLAGTLFWMAGGAVYAAGHISAGGWLLGITALFDVVDGKVARATGRMSEFGAFFDSTLDRVADAFVLGGLAYFYATSAVYRNEVMLVVCLLGLIGTFLVSYTRARGEAQGLELKVGFMQRPERVVLLSAPMAFFGLALDGMVLAAVIVFLTVTAWTTVAERIVAVYRATHAERAAPPAALPAAAGEALLTRARELQSRRVAGD